MPGNPSGLRRPRWPRLQFSLRLLLLALTAFAIGFPIWYRWPYAESESIGSAGGDVRISTWQRQWGGGRLKHGIERLISYDETFETTTYRNGLRNGPYKRGAVSGQYVDDLKEGVWTAFDRTMTWHRGKLDGPYEIRLPPLRPAATPKQFWAKPGDQTCEAPIFEPRMFHLVFSQGRLTEFNGKPATNRLFDLLASETDAIDGRISAELERLTQIDIVEMPVKDVALYLAETHRIPIVVDPKLGSRMDQPITCEYHSIDLCSALTLITAEFDLACDYRFGNVWITTAESAKDWHDPTGVAEIQPVKGSTLARAWNEPTAVDILNLPLAEVVAYLAQRAAIDIDTTQIEPTAKESARFSVTINLRGVPFRHVLGHLLYEAGCRCKLEDQTLVILPPESKAESEKCTY